eukprot:1128415-Pyramimonas_sp.AAC.1
MEASSAVIWVGARTLPFCAESAQRVLGVDSRRPDVFEEDSFGAITRRRFYTRLCTERRGTTGGKVEVLNNASYAHNKYRRHDTVL